MSVVWIVFRGNLCSAYSYKYEELQVLPAIYLSKSSFVWRDVGPRSALLLGMATGEVKLGELACAYPILLPLDPGLQGSAKTLLWDGKTQSKMLGMLKLGFLDTQGPRHHWVS